jgi:PQQ-like domain
MLNMYSRLALWIISVVCCEVLAPASARNITTYHYDNARTGWNHVEAKLTPSNVASTTFGPLVQVSLDAQVDAQPLVFNNVVYIATQNNTIYAIDAVAGTIINSVNLGAPVLRPGSPGSGCSPTGRSIGISSTPVIDAAAGVMYVVTYTYEPAETPSSVYRIHELTLPGLTEVTNIKISASHLLSDGTIFNFDARYQRQRPALLLASGNVYAAFSAWCDTPPKRARGWVLGWNKMGLTPLSSSEVTNTQTISQTPPPPSTYNDYFLSSIWMSGYGIAADEHGNLYFTTGNSNSVLADNLEESAVRMSPDLAKVKDYFTPYFAAQLDEKDNDFSAGGLMVVPNQTGIPPRAVAAGKDGFLYIMDRTPGNMGGYVPGGPNRPPSIQIGHCWCGPSYFIGSDGVGRIVTSGGYSVRTYKNTESFPTNYEAANSVSKGVQDPGFFTTISSNGTKAGSAIIWAVGRPTSTTTPSVTLYAFNGTATGTSLPLLYSAVAGTWSNFSTNANIVPVVANGKVYVASDGLLTIFGLLAQNAAPLPLRVTAGAVETAPTGPRIFGTITSFSGKHIAVRLRSGVSVSVDLTDAFKRGESAVPFAGENVEVLGEPAPDGSLMASSVQRTKEPATWGSDTWGPDAR